MHSKKNINPFNLCFEEMDIQWDNKRNVFVIGIKKRGD